MSTQSAQAKAAAITAAKQGVQNAANGTPQQKAAAQGALDRANAMPE